jgi:hypothetical protein
MTAPRIALDFAAPRVRTTVAGVAFLVFGLSAIALAGIEYHSVTATRAGLELRLAAALRSSSGSRVEKLHATQLSEKSTAIARELGTPWTAVLEDLESASQETHGQIAVLSIEPDHEKHRVRINAESRDLPGALAYVVRLESSPSLRYPMLDSHEVIADDKEHPVRFALTADWRELP